MPELRWQGYRLALDQACQTVSRYLANDTELAAAHRLALQKALHELSAGWGQASLVYPPLHRLTSTFLTLHDQRAIPARVSLDTIGQWLTELQEPGA